jgi:Xaa-Pro aminopeptidase
VVFVHQDDTPHRRETMTWIPPERIRAFPTGVVSETAPASALGPIADALAELGCAGGRVGVDIATVTVLRRLEELLEGFTVVDANSALNGSRLVKAPAEIAQLDDASTIVDLAMVAAEDAVQVGVCECDVLAEVMKVFYSHNAEVPQCNLIVCSGPNTAPMQRFFGKMQEMIIAHGIGVGYAEPPFIAPPGKPTPDLVLEPGMVLAVVPTIIVPGVPDGGGVRLEDVVVVTDDGPDVLTKAPYSALLLSS